MSIVARSPTREPAMCEKCAELDEKIARYKVLPHG